MTTVKFTRSREKSKSIFTIGNYVISKDSNQIVLVIGGGDWESVFSGIKIYHELKLHEGLYSTSYNKESFVQFVGTITITSDNYL